MRSFRTLRDGRFWLPLTFLILSIGVLCSTKSPSPGTTKPRSSPGISNASHAASPSQWPATSPNPVLTAEIRVRLVRLSEHRALVVKPPPSTPTPSRLSLAASSTDSIAARVTPSPQPTPAPPLHVAAARTTPAPVVTTETPRPTAVSGTEAPGETWQQATLALPWNGALMIRVGFCESTNNPYARNGSSFGIFQVQGETSSNPLVQVADAYRLWQVQGIGAWASSERCWG